MRFLAMLTLLTLFLTTLLAPALAAPTTDPTLPANADNDPNADLNLNNLTIAAASAANGASCAKLGGMCSHAKDCCDSARRCCCMTSLEDQGDPFANYEGFCCAKKGDSC